MQQGMPIEVYAPGTDLPGDEQTKPSSKHNIKLSILKVAISKPTQYVGRQFRPMLPCEARLRGLSYSSPIYIDFQIDRSNAGVITTQVEEKVYIGKIPIMVGSKYCHLYGRTNAERVAMGECPKDRGGYFIVNGSEKALIPQERPIENNISCFEEHHDASKYVARAEVKSTVDQRYFPIKITVVRLTKKDIKKGGSVAQKLVVQLPYSERDIPLFILFKALGVTSDKDIFSYLTDGTDDEITNLIIPSAIDGHIVKSQTDALTYVANSLKIKILSSLDKIELTPEQLTEFKLKYAQDILTREFLPHVGFDVTKKLRFLSLMVNNLLNAYFNNDLYTDRDKLTNKRLDLSGTLVAQIFRYWFLRLVKDIKQQFVKEIKRVNDGTGISLAQIIRRLMQKCNIENKIKYAISTGNWFTNRSQANSVTKKGISQVLQRLSYMGTLSHLRRINSPLERAGSKHEPPRRYHGTQVPKICPNETPEGAQVGTVKNLSLITHVTIETSVKPVLYCLKELGMVDITEASSAQVHSCIKILVNGDFVGLVQIENCLDMYHTLKSLKLTGCISKYISISWHTDFNMLVILTDGGRYIHPYYTIDEDNHFCMDRLPANFPMTLSKLTSRIDVDEDEGDEGEATYVAFNASYKTMARFKNSCATIEFLDTNEEETSMIAVTPHDLYNGQTFRKDRVVNKTTLFSGSISYNVDLKNVKASVNITDRVFACLNEKNSVLLKGLDVVLKDVDSRHVELSFTGKVTPHLLVLLTNLNRFLSPDYIVYTHCMLHPSMINGVVATCIPFPDHNQSPRNAYQSSMGKQAIGTYVTNYDKRMDTMSNIMVYPQVPTVATRTAKYTGLDTMHHGFTSMHGIACYGGYNQEDSLLSNLDSSTRGAFTICFYRTYINKLQKLATSETGGEHFAVPPDRTIGRKVGSGSEDRYHAIVQTPGKKIQLPAIGSIVKGNDIIIPKYRNHSSKKTKGATASSTDVLYTDVSTTVRATEGGVVDLVMPSPDLPYNEDEDGYQICKVRICELRAEEIGDKFASRSAQKGTVGMQYDSADMMINQDGSAPDKIMNAQAIPSRMTIGQLKEAQCSKEGIQTGKFHDATPFTRSNMGEIGDTLNSIGYDGDGDEIMYSGITGEVLNCPIFYCPTYYQRLKHMVADKIHARKTGPIQALTRQPAEGRSRAGGLRIGEMERDCFIAHGTAAYLKEKLTDSSDIFEVFVSKQRQTIIAANPKLGIFQHGTTDIYGTDDIHKLQIPYALHLFRMELKTSLVDYQLITA